jgi:hypothetical protein
MKFPSFRIARTDSRLVASLKLLYLLPIAGLVIVPLIAVYEFAVSLVEGMTRVVKTAIDVWGGRQYRTKSRR